jgi:hypothetical protein
MRFVDVGTFVQLDQDGADSYFPPRMKRGNDSPIGGYHQLFLRINGWTTQLHRTP